MFRYVLHVVASMLAFGVLVLSSLYIVPEVFVTPDQLIFTVDAQKNATIVLDIVQKEDGAYVSIGNSSNDTVTVHMPKALEPIGAFNVQVDNLITQSDSTERIAATLPANTKVLTEGGFMFTSVVIQNTNMQPLLVYYIHTDLRTNQVQSDSKLIIGKRDTLW